MIPNPIHKVLSTLCTNEVQFLLMGGQACVLYGAAEFSRACDIAIICDERNLDRLRAALVELEAEPVALPPFEAEYLKRGHAIHFRCRTADVAGIRIDVMAKMRGVAPVEQLWPRRTTLEDDSGVRIELMALPDLVAAKKTQLDKDWPMLRRLVEAHYAQHQDVASDEPVRFWLRESRTPEMLIELAARYPRIAEEVQSERPLLRAAREASRGPTKQALADEDQRERETDRRYWEPLKRELEQMRRERRGN